MRIQRNGNVGIGTNQPFDKLHVVGTIYATKYITCDVGVTVLGSYNTTLTARYYAYTGNAVYTASRPLSGYFARHVACEELQVFSDRRIKTNIQDISDDSALQTLRLIKPKTYTYKDAVSKGEETVYGFIAQEVRETLPYATSLLTEFIPNIYELATVSNSNVITFTDFNTSSLESNANTIRMKGVDGEDHNATIVEVLGTHTIRVEEDLTEFLGSVDEDGNVLTETTTTSVSLEEYEALEDKNGYSLEGDIYVKRITKNVGDQVFVYGQRVEDFVSLQKSAIFTVATSALQEVDRQQQADKLRIAELETQLASVLTRLDALDAFD